MAIRNIFHNYYHGKPGKHDFTDKDLPGTRIQLFKEVLKVRFGSMLSLNLFYLLFWLPAVIWTVLNVMQLYTIEAEMLPSLIFTYLLVLFPLIAITGPSTAGISFVMRNWARGEHSFPFADFVQGMKENWKQALLQSTISGAIPMILYMCIRFYGGKVSSSFIFYIPICMVLVLSLIWSLAAQIMPTMMVTYALSFRVLVKNCLLITMVTFTRSLAIKLITNALPIIMLICAFLFPAALSLLGTIVLTLYALFMLSFNKLVQASFANYVCEKYLNTKIEGAPVDIGLRSEH